MYRLYKTQCEAAAIQIGNILPLVLPVVLAVIVSPFRAVPVATNSLTSPGVTRCARIANS